MPVNLLWCAEGECRRVYIGTDLAKDTVQSFAAFDPYGNALEEERKIVTASTRFAALGSVFYTTPKRTVSAHRDMPLWLG